MERDICPSNTSQGGTVTPSSAATVTDGFTTESLKQLQSKDERRLLDVVDKLRRTGLNGTIELPQIVVCGDQSSGKSSVLEAITEIPFPRKAGLCTRFATEIVMRRHTNTSVTIKITPSKFRTEQEKAKLSAFSITIEELGDLPDVIDKATQEMGLGQVGVSRAFSRDVLSIEISGPDRPQLTLVDLPGLIHSATKASTDEDKDLIFDMVQEYMKNPRTIILAVVSAKNDAANQIVLNLFKKMDKKGSRTLGIITKPDCMSREDEQFWFDLHQNKEVFLERGWHMVKNRSESEGQSTFADRNAAEAAFFETSRFRELSRDTVGIEALRVRLSSLLLRHLATELPSLMDEMSQKLSATTRELESLGTKRDTVPEQRMLLTRIGMQVHEIISAALNGHYEHNFFKRTNMAQSIDDGPNIRRFRAALQFLNWKFAENMRLRGLKYWLQKERSPRDDTMQYSGQELKVLEIVYGELHPHGRGLKKKELEDWVKSVITHCRGHELPGNVNPDVTNHLFWELSESWKNISDVHVNRIGIACKMFVDQVLDYAAPAEMKKPLRDFIVNAALKKGLQDAKEELKKLVQDNARPPYTCNHYYTDTVQKKRQEKFQELFKGALGNVELPFGGSFPVAAQTAVNEALMRDMQTFAAQEALDSAMAIHKAMRKVFIDNVANQAIERCMIVPLPERILSPMVVSCMTDEEIAAIAAEPEGARGQRAFLEQRKQMLEQGFEIFREALGGVKGSREMF